jgi:hypothetical protein
MSEKETIPAKRPSSKVWLPVVLLVSFGLGWLSTIAPLTPEEPRGTHFPGPFSFNPDPLLLLHTFLSTVEIVLLISLLAVYVKVYMDSGARFSLGLVFVLSALLLNSIFSYPLVVGMVGPVSVGPGDFLPFADILEIIAYTAFLYLSLE